MYNNIRITYLRIRHTTWRVKQPSAHNTRIDSIAELRPSSGKNVTGNNNVFIIELRARTIPPSRKYNAWMVFPVWKACVFHNTSNSVTILWVRYAKRENKHNISAQQQQQRHTKNWLFSYEHKHRVDRATAGSDGASPWAQWRGLNVDAMRAHAEQNRVKKTPVSWQHISYAFLKHRFCWGVTAGNNENSIAYCFENISLYEQYSRIPQTKNYFVHK